MPGKPLEPPEGLDLITTAWNIMKGIDWNALPIVCEMLGVRDPELFIRQLLEVRQFDDGRNQFQNRGA